MMDFGKLMNLKLGTGADSQGRSIASAFTRAKNAIAGVYNYVTAWASVGKDVRISTLQFFQY